MQRCGLAGLGNGAKVLNGVVFHPCRLGEALHRLCALALDKRLLFFILFVCVLRVIVRRPLAVHLEEIVILSGILLNLLHCEQHFFVDVRVLRRRFRGYFLHFDRFLNFFLAFAHFCVLYHFNLFIAGHRS